MMNLALRAMNQSRATHALKAGRIDTASHSSRGLRHRLGAAILADWHGPRFLVCGAVVAVVASLTCIISFINQPAVPYDPDSPIYEGVANQVFRGRVIDPVRTPGYPLFIGLVRHVVDALGAVVAHVWPAGNAQASSLSGNPCQPQLVEFCASLEVLSIVQSIMFVLASVGVYALAALIFRRAWGALAVSLPVAANVMLVSYMRPIMTEAQALFLLVALALVLVWYIRAPQPRKIWLAMAILFAFAMTRPEWVFFSLPFAGFLLLIAWRGDVLRRMLPHTGLALVLFLTLSGLYAYGNARHGYFGFGANQNADFFGKVMQYQMQHEAPSRYAAITQEVDASLARGDTDPWHIILNDPALKKNWYALAGTYGRTIIFTHPVEFVADTIPVVFESLGSSNEHIPFDPNGPLSALMSILQTAASLVQFTLLLFPFIALAWWLRLVRPRKASELTVIMCGLALLCAYPLAITTLFVYTQYARMNAPFDPLMFVLVWLTAIFAIQRLAGPALSKLRVRSATSAPAQ